MTKGADMRGEMEQSRSWIEVSKLKQTKAHGPYRSCFWNSIMTVMLVFLELLKKKKEDVIFIAATAIYKQNKKTKGRWFVNVN